MQHIDNLILDDERALYGISDSEVVDCKFQGIKDGESALKECRKISVKNCLFDLRYPMWHDTGLTVERSFLTENCRAALWYCKDTVITDCTLSGIKAVRECDNVTVNNSKVNSSEFAWKSKNIVIENSCLNSEYAFLDSTKIVIRNVDFIGKYSFQYTKNLVIENSTLDTKDAFWHSKDVTVKNSVIKGEYLGWYSENLTLINCTIEGTQPLCYCKNLILKDCKMINTDLSFEYSDVNASVIGRIDSVKNVAEGSVTADSIGEIIKTEDSVYPLNAKITVNK